jgi:hypothetical protein
MADVNIALKRCAKCKINKPHSEFGLLKRASDGLKYQCKQCRKEEPKRTTEQNKQYYLDNKESLKAKCADYRNNRLDKQKQKEYLKYYYVQNAEKLKEKTRLWAKENKTRKLKADKEYRENNKEKIKIHLKNYTKQNRHLKNALEAKRRSVKLKSIPVWANKFFIKEAYNLAKLREKITGFKWHVDHEVPLKSKLVCGLHCEYNLQVIPAVKNISKGNRFWLNMP